MTVKNVIVYDSKLRDRMYLKSLQHPR